MELLNSQPIQDISNFYNDPTNIGYIGFIMGLYNISSGNYLSNSNSLETLISAIFGGFIGRFALINASLLLPYEYRFILTIPITFGLLYKITQKWMTNIIGNQTNKKDNKSNTHQEN